MTEGQHDPEVIPEGDTIHVESPNLWFTDIEGVTKQFVYGKKHAIEQVPLIGIWLALLTINATIREALKLDDEPEELEPVIPTISLIQEGDAGTAHIVTYRDIEQNKARVIVVATGIKQIHAHFRQHLPDCKVLEVDDGK